MDRLHRRRPPRPASPIPLAVSLTGGQRNDVTQLLALIDGVGPVRGKIGRPRQRAERLVADRGYDHDTYRRELPKRGVKPVIAQRGTDHGPGLGRERWVVERTFAHLHNLRLHRPPRFSAVGRPPRPGISLIHASGGPLLPGAGRTRGLRHGG